MDNQTNLHINLLEGTIFEIEESLERLANLTRIEIEITESLEQLIGEMQRGINCLENSLDVGHFYN